MVNRLLDYIEDSSVRREQEQIIQEQLEQYPELTVLTNTYSEDDKHILQLSTYVDGELYGGELILPSNETEREFFGRQLQDTLRAMEEAVR